MSSTDEQLVAQAAAVAKLRDEFPGTPIWYGNHTGHFWALAGDRLVEAGHPTLLAEQLEGPRRWIAATDRF